ncbi:MAG: glucosamine-6-phosphate isomerase [Candidatus Ornithospirochaeta sp.]|nr:glucosamine-6-phosphate isomerase [Candidatus Ornithospirochaeta sp.]
MDRAVFSYPKETLVSKGRIPVKCLGDSGEVFYEIALEMVREIEKNNNAGEKTVFICPVGPVGQYPIFVRLVNERKLSLRNCYFINMDEYLTDECRYISKDSPLSFRGFMERTVYSQIPEEINIPEENRFFPDPEDPGRIMRVIAELGKVDIAFGGIGINGHLAFNEAEEVSAEEFASRETRVLEISRETRVANAIGDLNGAIDAMPRYAVTIGMKEILMARKVRLGVFRSWHRAVLRQALFAEPSGHFPVTLLQNHPDALILANSEASKEAF